MLAWQIWLIIAGFCLILEIATVGFLLFWFAVAALITCVLSLFISNVIVQTAIFVLLSAVLVFLTRPLANKLNKKDNTITNANSVIGKEAVVTKEISSGIGSIGQVKIGGDVWSAICIQNNDSIPAGTKVSIIKIDGVKLIVEPIDVASKSEVIK